MRSRCKIDGCGSQARAKGLCFRHTNPETPRRSSNGKIRTYCNIAGCTKFPAIKGRCKAHHANPNCGLGDQRTGPKILSKICMGEKCELACTKGHRYCPEHLNIRVQKQRERRKLALSALEPITKKETPWRKGVLRKGLRLSPAKRRKAIAGSTYMEPIGAFGGISLCGHGD